MNISNGKDISSRPFSTGGFFDSTRLDAFGRIRVSTMTTIFDSKQIYDNAPLYFDEAQVSGSGTSSSYIQNNARTDIAVSNETAGERVRQTFRHFVYQPAKSQLVFISHILGGAFSGITKRLGLFNEKDGIYFGSHGTQKVFGIRSFTSGLAVDTVVNQANWNIDRLDGSGSSGVVLDTTKVQILVLDYEWLGVGSVRIGFVIDGKIIHAHQFNHANYLSAVYMSTPNLPIRFEIKNDGSGPTDSLSHICCSVSSEGGREIGGSFFWINRDNSPLVVSDNNIHPLIGLRLKSGNLGGFVRILSHSVFCISSSEYAWYVILNPTESGTSSSWLGLNNSQIEYSIGSAGTTLNDGTILFTGMGSDTNTSRSTYLFEAIGDLALGSKIDGTVDRLFLAVRRIAGGSETYYASLNIQDAI